MKAVVFTLGCKVNSQESASLMSGLKQRGYEVSDKLEWADIYVINTCAVTAEAEKKSRQAITRALKLNKFASVYVCGCASQKSPNVFLQKGVKVVTGAKSKDKLLDLLDEQGVFLEQTDEYYERYFPCKTSKTRAFVKIQDGCNNFCSYCIIPYLRGRSRSRSPQNILKEIQLVKQDEIVITGINISDYHYEDCDLAQLMSYFKDLDCRIRLGSIEVNVITDRLLQSTKLLKNFAPHFHLALQSGDDSVLKSMNRHYTTKEYLEKVNLIRSYYPDCAITTDVIVGYSTESDDNFNNTYDFCKQVGFSDIHCFPYSKREGTVGAKLKEIPFEIRKQRLDKLMDLKAQLKENYVNKYIDKCLDWIAEDRDNEYIGGYSQNYIRIYVRSNDLTGLRKVKLIKPFKDGALGEIVD